MQTGSSPNTTAPRTAHGMTLVMINLCARRKQKTCKYPPQPVPCHPVTCLAHTVTSSPSFKIHWGQGDGTQSICSTLSFAFHASRLFLKWQYFDAVRGTHYHYFNFRGDTTQHCGKQQRVGVTRLLVSTDALNGNGIYTHTLFAPSTNLCATILYKTVCCVLCLQASVSKYAEFEEQKRKIKLNTVLLRYLFNAQI